MTRFFKEFELAITPTNTIFLSVIFTARGEATDQIMLMIKTVINYVIKHKFLVDTKFLKLIDNKPLVINYHR